MFIAEVEFWGPEKGGRVSKPASGFKPHIRAGDVMTSCYVTSVDEAVSTFQFDKPYDVDLRLMFPDQYGYRLNVDSKVELFEGSRQIAEGKMISSV